MKLLEFDRERGIFNFELEEINTQFHVHPATEIIFSDTGNLTIETSTRIFLDVSLAVIPANVNHKIKSDKNHIQLLMVECDFSFLQDIFRQNKVDFLDEIFVQKKKNKPIPIFADILKLYKQKPLPKTTNPRIQTCLNYLESPTADYPKMIETLKAETYLSESRLSHIFKADMGISLKKYLVWNRLKKALKLFIEEEANLYEAAFRSGFYDQAHLSKAFKNMLGINPSDVYNSRMLQI